MIRTGRSASDEEVEQIIERIATAPFDRRVIPVPTRLRGLAYQGRTLGAREDALTYHLTKRVVEERQWTMGTTADEYLGDVQRAVRAAVARLTIYARRDGHIAATVTPISVAVPPARRTADSLPNVLVVYSADRGIILSGYQFSGLDRTGIPTEARWLR